MRLIADQNLCCFNLLCIPKRPLGKLPIRNVPLLEPGPEWQIAVVSEKLELEVFSIQFSHSKVM